MTTPIEPARQLLDLEIKDAQVIFKTVWESLFQAGKIRCGAPQAVAHQSHLQDTAWILSSIEIAFQASTIETRALSGL